MSDLSEVLPETHPEFSYFEPMTGILRHGRPIRSNFYVHKLSRENGERLERLIASADWHPDGVSLPPPHILAFISAHDRRWSQRVDRDGREF